MKNAGSLWQVLAVSVQCWQCGTSDNKNAGSYLPAYAGECWILPLFAAIIETSFPVCLLECPEKLIENEYILP